MKPDIRNRDDIELLVNSFYEKVKRDEVIGFIFNDVARVNWEKHLPVMYDFWENIVFQTGNYAGNPMNIHVHLNRLVQFTKEHFKRWLQLFDSTTDELFTGKKATLIKERAQSIAEIIEAKIVARMY